MWIARTCLSTTLLLGMLARAEDPPKPEEKHWSHARHHPREVGGGFHDLATGTHQSPVALPRSRRSRNHPGSRWSSRGRGDR